MTTPQPAGKTMTVHPRSLLLYCTAMFVYAYQTTTFPPHCGDNEKVKTQHIYQAMDIPVLLRGWVKQWLQMTGALYTSKYSPCVDPESVARGCLTWQRVFFNERIQIPLYKRAIIGPPVKRHLNGDSLACR